MVEFIHKAYRGGVVPRVWGQGVSTAFVPSYEILQKCESPFRCVCTQIRKISITRMKFPIPIPGVYELRSCFP